MDANAGSRKAHGDQANRRGASRAALRRVCTACRIASPAAMSKQNEIAPKIIRA